MKIREFYVEPAIPDVLKPLEELAYNLRWSWDPDTVDLFLRLDRKLWESSGHNPVTLLGKIEQERLEEASQDESFLNYLNKMVRRLRSYLNSPSWFNRTYPDLEDTHIAYFSAEFGIAECLPIYSGGLGMLAGDHLKSASDLGLPLVGIGLLYQRGYFHQYLNYNGWQQESTPVNDFFNMPMQLLYHSDGSPLMVEVNLTGRTVKAQIWRIDVGRVPLYLLDTNVPENEQEDREITDQLYSGDSDKRIRQEILLGIGGFKALASLGISPHVCHMNEGHSSFLSLERIRQVMEKKGLSFSEAREATTSGNIFTTHTPVPAGFDLFPPALMDQYFSQYWESMGLNREEFLGLGRENPLEHHAFFNMAILAIRLAGATNAVSKLHGTVSRQILAEVWPKALEKDVPISHVTNGIHTQTWVSRDMNEMLQRYIGRRWLEDFTGEDDWQRISNIPDEEIWRIHERRRERLIASTRQRLVKQLKSRGANRAEIETAKEALHPEALTIGFARRFATYKRATLILEDLKRFKQIFTNRERPIQIIFAGKAHPHDKQGKELIRQIVHLARDPELSRRMIFLEDYDMDIARKLVQGVDVWLNTPKRPMEASGTSGMKAAINGALNVSILDGWWYEAFTPEVGWAIQGEEQYEDSSYQDTAESLSLYDLLENEIIPLFYERNSENLPIKWIAMMKKSMGTLGAFFNTRRMVGEYTEKLYAPVARRWRRLQTENMEPAKTLANWKKRLNEQWKHIHLESLDEATNHDLTVGEKLEVHAVFHLGDLRPEELTIELFFGALDNRAKINEGISIPMAPTSSNSNGGFRFSGQIPCMDSGQCGYAIRVLPNIPDLSSPYDLGLVAWF